MPRAGRAALAVAALACQLMAPVGRASPAGPVDSPPAGTAAYIVSPKDGRWLFRAAGLRFDAVVIHYGETDGDLAYDSELYVDGQLYGHDRVFVPKVHADDQCLDPSAVLWRSGCTEVDIGVQIPGQALSEGHHRAHLFLRVPGDRSPLIHVSASFDVVSPPRVEVSFPSQDQNFACDGPLTLIFSHSTDYEPTADFLERGAGFHGAALLVNETRGTITDAGFVATPPLSHGTHQLRVALFDHRGVEIMYSTTANIPIHVSPRAAAAVSTDASDEHGAPRHGSEDEAGCQVVWLRPSADQRDVALAALAAAATPWLHRGGVCVRECVRGFVGVVCQGTCALLDECGEDVSAMHWRRAPTGCIDICISTGTCTNIYIYTRLSTCIYMHLYVCRHVSRSTSIFTHPCTSTCICGALASHADSLRLLLPRARYPCLPCHLHLRISTYLYIYLHFHVSRHICLMQYNINVSTYICISPRISTSSYISTYISDINVYTHLRTSTYLYMHLHHHRSRHTHLIYTYLRISACLSLHCARCLPRHLNTSVHMRACVHSCMHARERRRCRARSGRGAGQAYGPWARAHERGRGNVASDNSRKARWRR